MKVGLIADTYSVEVGTGIARYNNELLKGLESNGFHVVKICPKPPGIPMGDPVRHLLQTPYQLFKDQRYIDVFHGTSPINAIYFPLLKKPNLVTFHDISSMIYRQGSKKHVSATASYFYSIACKSRKIIAVSTQTKQELMTYFNCPEKKIAVIPPGVDEQFKPAKKNHENITTIGYIGSMVSRKRLDYLLYALRVFIDKYPGTNVKLDIYGKKSHEYDTLVNLTTVLKLSDYVSYKGPVPDSALVDTYNSFDIFIMPSDYEGFGIPVLEAQRCGIPVITRAEARIPEEVSRCSIKINNYEDMADTIYRLITDNNYKDSIIKEAIHYSKQFSWQQCTRKTIDQYLKP